MSTLIRWNPVREISAMERILNTMIEDRTRAIRGTASGDTATGTLALDVVENETSYIVSTTLPGVNADDIKISLHEDVLTISAEIAQPTEQKDGEHVLLRERTWGKFSRSVRLPNAVNGDGVEASYDNGVLHLTLPKTENAQPRTIPVKANKA